MITYYSYTRKTVSLHLNNTFVIKKKCFSFCWNVISLGIPNTIDDLTNFSIDIYDLHTNKKLE